ncbi:MAG TPA: PAS domain S-box protein [Methanobacteriaceae archaeon]|nr:PAS domain S-box protein [Methanobacteriaceae archaeon]
MEDDALIALQLQNKLESWGYQAIAAVNSSEEAVKKALLLQPDLILMDIVLSGEGDGIKAVRNIKRHVDVPVIYTTAYEDKITLERARETQPEAYLLKPYNFTKLKGFISMALEKREVVKNLKKVNSQYRKLFENSPNGILFLEVVMDHSGKVEDFLIKDANPAFEKMSAMKSEKLKELQYSQIFSVDDEDHLFETFAEVALLRKPAQIEYYSPGLKRYFEIIAFSTYKTELAVIFTDVTRNKSCEELIMSSQDNYRRLLENSGWVIYRISIPGGKLEYLSPNVEEMLGHTVEEFLQIPSLIMDVVHPDWKEDMDEKMKRALQGQAERPFKFPIICKDGQTRWIEQNNMLIIDENENPVALEVIIRDNKKDQDHRIPGS